MGSPLPAANAALRGESAGKPAHSIRFASKNAGDHCKRRKSHAKSPSRKGFYAERGPVRPKGRNVICAIGDAKRLECAGLPALFDRRIKILPAPKGEREKG